MGDPDISWRDSTAGIPGLHRDNFILQMREEILRRGVDPCSYLQGGSGGNVKLKAALAAVTLKWWSSRSLG